MALAFVRAWTATAASSTDNKVVITEGVAAPAGNLLVAAVTCRSLLNTEITAPAGWAKANGLHRTIPSAIKIPLVLFYKVTGAGEPVSYQFDLAASNAMRQGRILEFSGAELTGTLDVTATSVTNLSNSSLAAPAGTTGTTSQANEVVIAACAVWAVSPAAQTFSAWTGGFTKSDSSLDTATDDAALSVAYKLVTSAGTQTATANWTPASGATALIATFKEAITVPLNGTANALSGPGVISTFDASLGTVAGLTATMGTLTDDGSVTALYSSVNIGGVSLGAGVADGLATVSAAAVVINRAVDPLAGNATVDATGAIESTGTTENLVPARELIRDG